MRVLLLRIGISFTISDLNFSGFKILVDIALPDNKGNELASETHKINSLDLNWVATEIQE